MKERKCQTCESSFALLTRGDNARRYCSEKCSKKAAVKQTLLFAQRNPGVMRTYNRNRMTKNPGAWREKHREERRRIIEGLGGRCVVEGCGVTKQAWLHVDYIPTTRARPYRHPRHPGYILRNKAQFRLLCANHHYELTLTGAIEGSAIKSPRRRS